MLQGKINKTSKLTNKQHITQNYNIHPSCQLEAVPEVGKRNQHRHAWANLAENNQLTYNSHQHNF